MFLWVFVVWCVLVANWWVYWFGLLLFGFGWFVFGVVAGLLILVVILGNIVFDGLFVARCRWLFVGFVCWFICRLL